MNRRNLLVLSIAALGFTLLFGDAIAQQKSLKDQLIGTWTFVSSTGRLADGVPPQPLVGRGRYLDWRR